MQDYYALSLVDLAAIICNEKKTNLIAEQIYRERRRIAHAAARSLAYLAQEEPYIIGFPRHPEFYAIFTTQNQEKLTQGALFDPEQQYADFEALCYLETAFEVFSIEDAKALLRSHFHELPVEPTLISQGKIYYGLWTFYCSNRREYLETCDALLRDDSFQVLKGSQKILL